MIKKILITIIFIALISSYVASDIALRKMEEEFSKIDMTIYKIEEENRVIDIEDAFDGDGLLQRIRISLSEYGKKCNYKYYKKLRFVNYCSCSKCKEE